MATPVLDPRNGLPLVIGVSITNANARTQVRAMNPVRALAASYVQQQDGLAGGVGFLRPKLGDHAELVSETGSGRVTLPAGLARRPQRVNRRGNGTGIGI
jgi:hypothetical protein